MKVLLFTHSQDIDGMGCAVLAKEAFDDLKVEPTKTFDITKSVKSYIENGKINDYDLVLVTDLCIKEPVLKEIDNSPLKDKLLVLDHHKSEIDEGNDKYDFVNITIEKGGQKVSGTSLFYEYLLEHNYLKRKPIYDEIVELTRSYDVWDWKQNNQTDARHLHILFEVLGKDKYLELMEPKLKCEHFAFTPDERQIIADFNKKFNEEIHNILSTMKVVNLDINNKHYKIGYVKTIYKYRNDLNEFVQKDNKYDVDALGMIMTDFDTVSYRQVKDIDVSIIASFFGGKGHRAASSNPQNNPDFIQMCQNNNIAL